MTKALLLRGMIVQTSHSKRENTVIIYIVSMLFFFVLLPFILCRFFLLGCLNIILQEVPSDRKNYESLIGGEKE